jgi:hypothetical protein
MASFAAVDSRAWKRHDLPPWLLNNGWFYSKRSRSSTYVHRVYCTVSSRLIQTHDTHFFVGSFAKSTGCWSLHLDLPRAYLVIYRGPNFLAIVWLGSSPNLSFSPISKLDPRHTGRLRNRTTCWQERGKRGWGRSQIIRRRESLVLYKSFNTLYTFLTLDSHITPITWSDLCKYVLRIGAGFNTVQCINKQQIADVSTLFTKSIATVIHLQLKKFSR